MALFKLFSPKRKYSEAELIKAIQQHDKTAQDYFYSILYEYYKRHFNDVRDDKQLREDIFHNALIKLWTEIENKKIRVTNDIVVRQKKDGKYYQMTASLTTFFITFSKNELREARRQKVTEDIDDFLNSMIDNMEPLDVNDTEYELKLRIADECLQSMTPNCLEIITLAVLRDKTLDEIMAIRGSQNSSKDGLKAAKSKCMTTLKGKIILEFKKYNLAV